MSEITVAIVDGLNLVRRIYPMCPEDSLTELSQRCQHSLVQISQLSQATHLLMVFDGDRNGWRSKIFNGYKQGRSEMPPLLAEMLPKLQQHLAEQGFISITAQEEADDAIASIATALAKQSIRVGIVSTDKGFWQLLNHNIIIWDHFNRIEVTPDYVQQKLQIPVSKIIDYWAICGVGSNTLPGIKGIGPKGAVALLSQFESLQQIYQHIEQVPNQYKNKLINYKEDARLTYKLAQLKTDIRHNLTLANFRLRSA